MGDALFDLRELGGGLQRYERLARLVPPRQGKKESRSKDGRRKQTGHLTFLRKVVDLPEAEELREPAGCAGAVEDEGVAEGSAGLH